MLRLSIFAGFGMAVLWADQRKELATASLEELMNLEISSVARKQEKLSRTAAAVFVITQEDIRRSGAVSLPEVLRLAPGLQVARIDPGKWAVSARGFNGRFANKMLVLIDGRSIYTQLYSGTYWDQNDILLEDIERIEVIRGPGATTWGANAMNGVINIITKTAADTGGLVTAGGGPGDGSLFGARYAGKASRRLRYRVSTRLSRLTGMEARFPVQGLLDSGALSTARGGARVEWDINERDSLALHADLYQGGGRQFATDTIGSNRINRVSPEDVSFTGGYAQARWRRTGENTDTALQWFWNQENRAEGAGELRMRTVDLDFQTRRRLGRKHDLIWGLGYRSVADNLAAVGNVTITPPARETGLASSFVQHEWSLAGERLVLTAGTKFLHQEFSGAAWQPGVRLSFAPNPRRTLWTSVTRAVRTPSRRDQDIAYLFRLPPELAPEGVFGRYTGTRAFRNENVTAVEAGWRQQFSARWALDVALFRSAYGNLEAIRPGTPEVAFQPALRVVVPLALANRGSAVGQGGEAVLQWQPASRWRASLQYSYLMLERRVPPDVWAGLSAPRDPRHQGQAHLAWDASRRITLDAFLFAVGSTAAGAVPAYARADVRLAWRLGEHAELSGGGRNLLDSRHREFVPEDFVLSQQARRSVYARFTWRF